MIYSNFCSTSVTIIHILSVSHCRLNGEHNPICVTQESLNETKYKSEIDLTLCISLVLCAVGAKDVQD